MKIIISHDVDHISSYEHWNDLIVPKFLARSGLEKMMGKISWEELSHRILELLNGHWSQVQELVDYNTLHHVQASFFVAVAKGRGLAYGKKASMRLVDLLKRNGQEVALHGMARNSLEEISEEKKIFEAWHAIPCRGMRFHYLAEDKRVLDFINDAGFLFDSSFRGDGKVWKHGECWVFPMHIMDGDVFLGCQRYQMIDTKQAVVFTKERICKLADAGVDYCSILFHDRYFSNAHRAWKDWYMEIVEWIKRSGVETCNYSQAIAALNARGQ